jgi:Domain of unknown function (DUF4326)
MPRVLNKHRSGIPSGAVYIGRGSAFGNPFEIPRDGDREEVIEKFLLWIKTQPKLIERVKLELRGRDLVCYCSPQACHGNILLSIANDQIYTPAEAKSKKRKQQCLFS